MPYIKQLSQGGTLRITLTVKDSTPGANRWSPDQTTARSEVTVDLPAVTLDMTSDKGDWQGDLRALFIKQADNAARAAWGQYFDALMSRWDNPATDVPTAEAVK